MLMSNKSYDIHYVFNFLFFDIGDCRWGGDGKLWPSETFFQIVNMICKMWKNLKYTHND